MSLKITTEEKKPGTIVVKLVGRLDTTTSEACDTKLRALIKGGARSLLLDMEKLEYISSMGLRVILKVRKAIDAKKGSVVITNVQPQIQKVFEIANALPAQSIFASVEEADHYLDRMQSLELEKQRKLSKPS